ETILDRSPFGFGLTRGTEHRLAYANETFLRAVAAGRSAIGRPLSELIRSDIGPSIEPLLHRVLQGRSAAEEPSLGRLAGGKYWGCSVWPIVREGGEATGLAVELVPATHARQIVALQREMAGRLLLSALRESDAAD